MKNQTGSKIRALSAEELAGVFDHRLLGCRVCGDPQPSTYEVSRLEEEGGEVSDSSVLQLLHFCDRCADSFVSGEWEALSRRGVKN